jgi:hypothetical protein
MDLKNWKMQLVRWWSESNRTHETTHENIICASVNWMTCTCATNRKRVGIWSRVLQIVFLASMQSNINIVRRVNWVGYMLKKMESRREEAHQFYVNKQQREERGTVVDQSPTDFTIMPLSILRRIWEGASFFIHHHFSYTILILKRQKNRLPIRRKSEVHSAESSSRQDTTV